MIEIKIKDIENDTMNFKNPEWKCKICGVRCAVHFQPMEKQYLTAIELIELKKVY